ncbi:MAG: HEAT repeat domain-containing protein [Nitrospirales bacterium]
MKPYFQLALVFCVTLCFFVETTRLAFAQQQAEPSQSDLSVYVDIDASTWKTRGRIFYDVEGALRRKLTSAGFTIVHHEQEPHVFTLSVRYHEEKSVQYAITKYGTVLRANFSLFRETLKPLWKLNISEISENSVSGTPPYLDVLQKFDTNPYYFFIGGLLRTFLEKELNVEQALLELVRKVAFERSLSVGNPHPTDSFLDSDHSMDSSQEFYLPTAMLRSIQELVRREDRGAIPVLTRLLDFPHQQVRASASKALGIFEDF